MMFRFLTFAVALATVVLLAGPTDWAGVDAMTVTAVTPQDPGTVYEIRITGTTGARRRLAIPEFTTPAGSSAEIQAAAKSIAQVLWDDIEFERERRLGLRLPPSVMKDDRARAGSRSEEESLMFAGIVRASIGHSFPGLAQA